MLDNLNRYSILLASNSPRRRELLSGLGIPFSTTSLPDVDESFPETLEATEIPVYIAQKKAEANHSQLTASTLLITADTIVWLNGKVYGKPHDEKDAKQMLHDLSGKTHQVITGVCLRTQHKEKIFYALTDVSFAELTNEEIDYYVSKYKPMDKAGAYGIQEWIGFAAVKEIKGSYFNVMGLPIHQLYRELKCF